MKKQRGAKAPRKDVRKQPKTQRPRGRPTLFTPAVGRDICETLVEERSMVRVCQKDGMPKLTTVYRWESEGEEDVAANKPTDKARFSVDLARAKKWQAQAIFEDAVGIADDGRNDWMVKETQSGAHVVLNHEHVSRSKLRVDTRLAIAERLYPERYSRMQKLADADGKKLPAGAPPFTIYIDGKKADDDTQPV